MLKWNLTSKTFDSATQTSKLRKATSLSLKPVRRVIKLTFECGPELKWFHFFESFSEYPEDWGKSFAKFDWAAYKEPLPDAPPEYPAII